VHGTESDWNMAGTEAGIHGNETGPWDSVRLSWHTWNDWNMGG
jgi:hypothetical protein